MIWRFMPGAVLVDREALSHQAAGRPLATIRVHCAPVACDARTRRVLYDLDASVRTLSWVTRRHRGA